MAFFKWAAPVFARFGDRWSEADIAAIARWLGPCAAPGSHILDLGGGTGSLALHLADATHAHITVLDVTPEMLEHVPEDERITAVLGGAERMPFEDDEFDACLVSDAFHHFRDQDRAVREIARVVRPGGGVVLLELDPTTLGMRLLILIEKLVGEPGYFFAPDALCEFMATRSIPGDCVSTNSISYRFVGFNGGKPACVEDAEEDQDLRSSARTGDASPPTNLSGTHISS
jgi:SAM-dependent methyltransferase